MTNEWILDVLTDLTAFARKNGMTRLEQQLILAKHEAIEDFASNQMFAQGTTHQGLDHVGVVYRSTAGGPNT